MVTTAMGVYSRSSSDVTILSLFQCLEERSGRATSSLQLSCVQGRLKLSYLYQFLVAFVISNCIAQGCFISSLFIVMPWDLKKETHVKS